MGRQRRRGESADRRRGGLAWVAAAVTVAAIGGGIALAARFRDVPDDHWARPQIEASVERKLLDAPEGKFDPDRPVTRAELAVVLIRLVDAIEKAGPKPADKSPAKHDVPQAHLDAVGKLPANHRATPALRRLVREGYLSPVGQEESAWLPKAEDLDKPATAGEVSRAVTSVILRIKEKQVAVEHPEALKEGLRPETR